MSKGVQSQAARASCNRRLSTTTLQQRKAQTNNVGCTILFLCPIKEQDRLVLNCVNRLMRSLAAVRHWCTNGLSLSADPENSAARACVNTAETADALFPLATPVRNSPLTPDPTFQAASVTASMPSLPLGVCDSVWRLSAAHSLSALGSIIPASF